MKNSKIDSLDKGNKLKRKKNYSIVKAFMFPRDRKKIKMTRLNDLESRWKQRWKGRYILSMKALVDHSEISDINSKLLKDVMQKNDMNFFKTDKTYAFGLHEITMTRFDLLPEQANKQTKKISVFQDN